LLMAAILPPEAKVGRFPPLELIVDDRVIR
jgi:hypothetical protein